MSSVVDIANFRQHVNKTSKSLFGIYISQDLLYSSIIYIFCRYFLDLIEQNESNMSISNPVGAFRFQIENRTVDNATGKVMYSDRREVLLPISIDLSLAINSNELATYAIEKSTNVGVEIPIVRPRVPLLALLDALFADQHLDDFVSPVNGERAGADQRTRFKTFPDFLLLQAQVSIELKYDIYDNSIL